MKILSEFLSLSNLTASSSATNFPVENITNIEPMQRWKPATYAADVSIVIDFLTAQTLNTAFLNRCNFPVCKIQGNDTDIWTAPAFEQSVNLSCDIAENRKAWVELENFNYRYLRIVIASGQTLDNSETLPAIGNLIAGTSENLPMVSAFTTELIKKFDRWESDGGSYHKQSKGRARHVVSLKIDATLSEMRSFFVGWDYAVLFADLGNVSDAWLVFGVERLQNAIRNPIDTTLLLGLEEKP